MFDNLKGTLIKMGIRNCNWVFKAQIYYFVRCSIVISDKYQLQLVFSLCFFALSIYFLSPLHPTYPSIQTVRNKQSYKKIWTAVFAIYFYFLAFLHSYFFFKYKAPRIWTSKPFVYPLHLPCTWSAIHMHGHGPQGISLVLLSSSSFPFFFFFPRGEGEVDISLSIWSWCLFQSKTKLPSSITSFLAYKYNR